MHLLIDESKSFIFTDKQNKIWQLALVVGVILPYESRQKFMRKYSAIKKHMRDDPVFVCTLLDDLINWGVQGTLITGDCGNITLQEAERYRSEYFLKPLYEFADRQPFPYREGLRSHLDNLAGGGEYQISTQDFFKLIVILETITRLVELYLRNLSHLRSIDVRQVQLIIDDQCKAALMTIHKGFVGFFLNCRSQDGVFNLPPSCAEFRRLYTRKEADKTLLDATKFLKNIVIDDKKKMDDRYPELMIADILAVTTTRLLKGNLNINMQVVDKLLEIFKNRNHVQFHPDKKHLDISIPPGMNQDVIRHFLNSRPVQSPLTVLSRSFFTSFLQWQTQLKLGDPNHITLIT